MANNNPLADLRKRNVEAKEADGNTDSNITSNTTDQPDNQPDALSSDNTPARPTAHKTKQPEAQHVSQPDGNAATKSDEWFDPPKPKPRYVAVTFKLLETEQEWVDKHVKETGRLKQDVLTKAIQMYRSLYEERQRGKGNG